jgi:hypothetical protein
MLFESRNGVPNPIAPVTDVSTLDFAAMLLKLCPIRKLKVTLRAGVVCDLFV